MQAYPFHSGHTSVLIHAQEIADALKQAPIQGKKTEFEPFKSQAKELGVPTILLEDCQVSSNKVEIHTEKHDLWLCLEGEAIFIMNGTVPDEHVRIKSDGNEDPTERRGTSIEGGDRITLKQGDWLWIPAGVPHQHQAEGTARFMVIKIPKQA